MKIPKKIQKNRIRKQVMFQMDKYLLGQADLFAQQTEFFDKIHKQTHDLMDTTQLRIDLNHSLNNLNEAIKRLSTDSVLKNLKADLETLLKKVDEKIKLTENSHNETSAEEDTEKFKSAL